MEQQQVMRDAIAELTRQGATVVDPADIPSIVDWDPARNFLDWPVCSGADNAKGNDANCSTTYKYGMKRDFSRWLALLGDAAPLKSLTELRAWNEAHRTAGTLKYGQSNLDNADEIDLVTDRARYEADRVRLWTTYNLDLRRFGNLAAGLLWRYDSPQTFTYTATVARSAISKALNPGYHNAPTTVSLAFGPRGLGQYNPTSLFDTSVQYSYPIARVTPWIKFDVRNVFNKTTLIAYNTSITAAGTDLDSFGYQTAFTNNATFGRPTATTNYVIPRQYLLYAGVRF